MAPQGRLDPLTQVEAYALASLFMVSLNETLWEAVAEPGPAQRGLWGPDGLCRAICAQLDVPERAWEVRGGEENALTATASPSHAAPFPCFALAYTGVGARVISRLVRHSAVPGGRARHAAAWRRGGGSCG
jgi:hypothetical protein